MRILHVSLSDPQVHSGGLNRYCKDLMKAEETMGHNVFGLYAGGLGINHIKIKKIRYNEYIIVGALPESLTYGISKPREYMKKSEMQFFEEFLNSLRVDVIHVHSLMGIYKEFFEAAESLNIPMLFTTHDYYPICFKCNLLAYNNCICESYDIKKCSICNANFGMTRIEQILVQSNIYHRIKNNKCLIYFKKKLLKNRALNQTSEQDIFISDDVVQEYKELHDYYSEIMQMMKTIHCNSDIAKNVFSRAFPQKNYTTIPISRYGLIRKKREERASEILRISYFGGLNKQKGYFELFDALKLLDDVVNWECNLYGYGLESSLTDRSNIHYIGYFDKEKEEIVWENTDLVIVPSQWPETYGYVVLEALAYGIPVVCSDLVGAKILLENIKECTIYSHGNTKALANLIRKYIDRDYYNSVCSEITKIDLPLSMEEHAKYILAEYELMK